MPTLMRYRGKNDFYDGWLAKCYGQPFDGSKNEAWKEGWRMGDETSTAGRALALAAEIRLGRNIEPVTPIRTP